MGPEQKESVRQREPYTSETAVAESVLEVRIPDPPEASHDQDEEWCEVHVNGNVRRVRFHDYAEIYAIPGLYEQIFYDELECDSPRTVCSLLSRALEESTDPPDSLCVLEVGAGNGMVGEELDRRGAQTIVGVDIIDEAAEAAARDRPGIYDDYKVMDLTCPPAEDYRDLERRDFNCLVTVAALGFGDIPPEAFSTAYDLVEDGGWVAFNIKEDFLRAADGSGFSSMIRGALSSGALEVVDQHRYQHRRAIDGQPIHYVAAVGRKRGALDPGA